MQARHDLLALILLNLTLSLKLSRETNDFSKSLVQLLFSLVPPSHTSKGLTVAAHMLRHNDEGFYFILMKYPALDLSPCFITAQRSLTALWLEASVVAPWPRQTVPGKPLKIQFVAKTQIIRTTIPEFLRWKELHPKSIGWKPEVAVRCHPEPSASWFILKHQC